VVWLWLGVESGLPLWDALGVPVAEGESVDDSDCDGEGVELRVCVCVSDGVSVTDWLPVEDWLREPDKLGLPVGDGVRV
jgi:hypothetical protein